jgi:mRNA interferase MazF
MDASAAGSVVLVIFPFSDLSHAKLRPALVLARAGHEESILAQITSRPYADSQAFKITDQDFLSGSLRAISYVRPAKLFTAHTSLIKAEVGRLKPDVLCTVIHHVVNILACE